MKRIAIVLLVTAVWAARAEAQPTPWQPERLTAGWVFTPSVVLGALWDSNVTVRNQGDRYFSEWVGLVSPRGELDYNGRRTHLNLGYSGALERYRRFEELNRYEQRGRFELRQQLTSRLGAYTSGSLSKAPTTDRLDMGAGTLPFVDVGSQIFSVGGGVRLRATRRTNVQGSYGFQDVQFDGTERESFPFLQGGQVHSFTGSVMQDFTGRFSAGGTAGYQRAYILEQTQRFDVQNVTGDVAYRISEYTSIGAGAGVSRLESSTLQRSASGPAFHASLQHTAGTVSMSVRGERSFVPSYTVGGVTTHQSIAASARVPFARGRAYLSGSVGYGRSDPVEELAIGFGLESVLTTVTVGYQLAPWLRGETFYTGSHQNSEARGNIDRARIGIQFVTIKPMRIQ